MGQAFFSFSGGGGGSFILGILGLSLKWDVWEDACFWNFAASVARPLVQGFLPSTPAPVHVPFTVISAVCTL